MLEQEQKKPTQEYVSPTNEDLDWSGLSREQKRDLLEHWIPIQQKGIELGHRPNKPVGIMKDRDLFVRWKTQVWGPWQKSQGIDPKYNVLSEGRFLHTHPVQPPSTLHTTLRRN